MCPSTPQTRSTREGVFPVHSRVQRLVVHAIVCELLRQDVPEKVVQVSYGGVRPTADGVVVQACYNIGYGVIQTLQTVQ